MASQLRTDAVFDAAMSSVPAARRFVVAAAREWLVDEDLEWSAALAVTELAANAVIHAATSFRVTLSGAPDRLRVEVSDGSTRRPRPRHYGADATTGRGLALVANLSTDWGSTPDECGKTVWCVLHVTEGSAEPEPDLDAFADPFDDPDPGDALETDLAAARCSRPHDRLSGRAA